MLWQNHFRAEAGTMRAIVALADPVEPIAGGDHPGARGRAIQVFAKVLEYGGMLGWNCCKVVQCFVDTGRQACGRHVVAQYPLIYYLSEKTRLGRQLLEHVGNILLAFGGAGLLIPSPSAKRNDDDLPLLCRGLSVYEWTATHQCAPECQTSRTTQKVASAAAKMPGELMGSGNRRSK